MPSKTTKKSENEAEAPKEDGKFYGDAEKYWSGVPATVDGMLGGFGSISTIDIHDSLEFSAEFLEPEGETKRGGIAVDCGSGIGRITKHLLTKLASQVDMVEVNPLFLQQAKDKFLGEAAAKVSNYFCSGLQDFIPEEGKYDIIWTQWVLGQLRDDHLVEFFKRCKSGLAPKGTIFLKENINGAEKPDFDEADSSYCRSRNHLVSLIEESGLKIIKEKKITRFPKGLLEVRAFACK